MIASFHEPVERDEDHAAIALGLRRVGVGGESPVDGPVGRDVLRHVTGRARQLDRGCSEPGGAHEVAGVRRGTGRPRT